MAFQIDIKSDDMFKKEVLETPDTLQVLEVYNDWCGPCKAINATCKRLYFDNGDRGLKFYTVVAGTLDFTMPYRGKCKPIFMFYRNGEELKDSRLEGIDTPKLVSTVMQKLDENVPAQHSES